MATCICAADLNRLLSVQRIKSTATVDASGRVDESDSSNWETFGSEWCKIVTKGSREFVVGDQINAQATHQLTLRYSGNSAAYTAQQRLLYGTRIFNIAGPPRNIDEQNKWVQIDVIEVK